MMRMIETNRRGKMVRLLLGGWVCGLLLGGCASSSQPATTLRPEGYAHQKEDMNLAVYWNVSREADRVTVQGYVQSIAPSMVVLRSVQVMVLGYDAEGREVVRSRPVFSHPSELNVEEPPWDQGVFKISLPIGDVVVSRFDLKTFAIEGPLKRRRRRRRW